MPLYGFDEESVRRIGETVRLVESGRSKGRKDGTDKSPRGAVGVRCMIGKIGTAAWSKASSATITIYAGEPGSESSAETAVAHNYFASISTSSSTARWVAVSNNGYGWLLIAAECD